MVTGRNFVRPMKPRFTDLAVLMGPDTRWTENAYEDMERQVPEVFLGYRVRLALPSMRLQGYRIAKLVVLEPVLDSNAGRQAVQNAFYSTCWDGGWGRIEVWDTHFARGCCRTDVLAPF